MAGILTGPTARPGAMVAPSRPGGLLSGRTDGTGALSWAGGVATDAEIFSAAYEQMRLVENTTASHEALVTAYEDWRREIRTATGEEPPDNPMLYIRDELPSGDRLWALMRHEFTPEMQMRAGDVDSKRAEFQDWVNTKARTLPAEATRSWAERSPEQAARQLARSADSRLGQLMDSNPNWGKYVTAFAGGGVGALRDPLVAGTLAFGGGAGAAKTVAGRILTVAASEALLNGAVTAAAQPWVQDWRRRAGLSSGFDEAAQNVLFAAGLGGAFGAVGGGIGEAASGYARSRAGRQTQRQLRELALADPQLGDTARRALAGDTGAAAELLGEVRERLPPAVRGALDAMEVARLERSQIEAAYGTELSDRPPPAPAFASEADRADEIARQQERRHDLLLQRAANAERIGALPDLALNDPARVNRLVRELAPRPESIGGALGDTPGFTGSIDELRNPARAAEQQGKRPVLRWVRQLGGVVPGTRIAEELNALGINSRSAPGVFSKAGRKALDNMPATELPTELRHMLRPDGDTGYVREQDIIDALDQEWRAGTEATRNAEDQRRWYEENGVDFEAMSDAEIRAQMEAIADAERRFLAAEPNDLGLSTDEVAFLPPGATRRAYTADVVSQVLHRLGAGVSDDVVKMAADTHIVAGESLEDAIDFAVSSAAGTPRNPPPSQFADLPSDPPVPAADAAPTAARAAPAEGEADPDAIDWAALEAEGFGSGAEIPYGDDLVSLEALKADLDETAWLERVVEACKL